VKGQSAIVVVWMRATYVNLHLGVQAIIHDQAVGHPYAVRLHGMPRNVGIVADV
jgi:hypothetical protein